MALTKIKKRNGLIADFDRNKIANAISMACQATNSEVKEETITAITDKVLSLIEIKFTEAIPGVEDIQDAVEQQLAENGLFEVAKAYILYRKKQQELREVRKSEIKERAEKQQLTVTKRDSSVVSFDGQEIIDTLKGQLPDLVKQIDFNEIVKEVEFNLFDGISTKEITKLVGIAVRGRVEKDQIYSQAGARILFNDLYKDILGYDESYKDFKKIYKDAFANQIKAGVKAGRLAKAMLNYDIKTLTDSLDIERDKLFTYLGAQTLYDRYFIRDADQNILELPQHFWMRVAMGLALNEKEDDRNEKALEFYETISALLYVPSTPTLFHSGTNHPQMSSCYLTTVEDDLAHIFKSIGDNAQLSKWSGGLGGDWTNIRATGSAIKSTNVGSQGVIPFLKIADATTGAINRSGKRRGAACVYLETWHYDIESFLELRKNTGDDRRRTHDTNTSNWIPDLFMQRVINDRDWTLFSPDETPELHHIYGQEFKKRYEEYEAKAAAGEIKLFKKIKAKDLWRKMITMLFETGHPWITFKDPINIRSPQDHTGVVHSSNLCTEITLNTSADETAVCNLGSINLARHMSNGQLNRELIKATVTIAIRMLDNVIDLNFYPTPEAENSNLKHRPIGLGIMGLQDALFMMKQEFDGDVAVEFSDEMMEYISYYAILSSSQLAKERSPYKSYKGSKWDRGIFPLDTIELLAAERGEDIEVDRQSKMDWAPVREHVKQYGMRNSNTMAVAPTATISNIAGCLPTIEPIYKNLYVKSNASGEFTVLNKYLVAELKKIDLWNQEMIEKIKHYDGSIQKITEIPAELRQLYREVFEIDTLYIIKHAARRAKWIDQSQSVNIFSNTQSGAALSKIYQQAWRSGLKTTYYLRTLGATTIEKSTVDINKKYDHDDNKQAKHDHDHDHAHEHHQHQPVVAQPSTVGAKQTEPIAVAVPASSTDEHPDDLTCEACQ
ncbi:ribonucleoside-diphosphate reductase subunit alpha [Patescibacteria group bacterium]